MANNYLLVYHGGGPMPATPEEGAQVMKAWTDWFGTLGPALVDGGNPASVVKSIGSDGAVRDGTVNPPTGYSIIKADGIDSAVGLAKGCPLLAIGGTSIEVVETVDAM